ncbi:MAG: hypothetical protein NTX03_09835 [Bacteroidetes bacterium]|nr:hypothetical protein [Bacteroidota bacterium]
MDFNDNGINQLWEKARSQPPLMDISEVENLISTKAPISKAPTNKWLWYSAAAVLVTVISVSYLSFNPTEKKVEVRTKIENTIPSKRDIGTAPENLSTDNSVIIQEDLNLSSQPKQISESHQKNKIQHDKNVEKPITNTLSLADANGVKEEEKNKNNESGTKKSVVKNSENPITESNPNSLENSHFTLRGWKLKSHNPYAFRSGVDKEESHSGVASGFINANKDNYNSAWLTQQMNATQYKGKRVRMTAWVKSNDKGKKVWAGIFLTSNNGENKVSGFDNLYERKVHKAKDWNKCEIVMDIPDDSRILNFGLYKVYEGRAWIDDISFEVVDKNTPLSYKKTTEVSDTLIVVAGLRAGISINKKPSNLGFEKGFSNENSPKGWFLDKEDLTYKLGIDDAKAHSGDGAAFIVGTNADKSDWNSLSQIIRVNDFAGKRIRLSGWMKSENLSDYASLWMRVDDYKSRVNTDVFNNRVMTGSNDWKQYEITLDVPENANTISFGMLLHRNGKAWLDDLKIEVVSQNIYSTESIKSAPINLGFEE